MKLVFLLLMLLLFLPFSSASIESIRELDNEYSLGDDIGFSLKIVPNITVNALVKLTLKCTEREVPYYIAPISLEQGKEINVEAPRIKAFSAGLCNIRINIESLEGSNLDGMTSKEFTISNRLELSFTVDKTDVLPGDKIKVEGTAMKKGNAVKDGSIVIVFDDKKRQIGLDGVQFSYELELNEKIKSGEHTVIVKVNDSYGNSNEGSKIINVKAVPTKLEFSFDKKEFMPTETLKFKTTLLDQADDNIEGNVNLKLFREGGLFRDEIIIFDLQKKANEEFEFAFNSSTPPYDYILRGSFGELKKEDIITVLDYLKIDMRVEGYIIFIKNVGNVDYNNKTTILVEKEGKTYFIDKKIKLDVGEETTIDLSKEVPAGSYTIILPPDTVREEHESEGSPAPPSGDYKEKIVEKIVEKEVPVYAKREEGEKEDNVIKNVQIEDNRPLYKKGLSRITGGVVAGAGVLLSKPGLSSLIIILVLINLLYYFNRKKVKEIIEKIKEKRIKRY